MRFTTQAAEVWTTEAAQSAGKCDQRSKPSFFKLFSVANFNLVILGQYGVCGKLTFPDQRRTANSCNQRITNVFCS
jgi:hypothetical protein